MNTHNFFNLLNILCGVNFSWYSFRIHGLPSISALTCHGGLLLGAGTSTGHVILYDIRSGKPLIVKDHMNDLPIKDIVFHKTMDYVYSVDSSILKIWDRNNVRYYFNDINYFLFCLLICFCAFLRLSNLLASNHLMI